MGEPKGSELRPVRDILHDSLGEHKTDQLRAQLLLDVYAANVQVETRRSAGVPDGAGSGFFVGADTIMTNAHVVKKGVQHRVILWNGETVAATVQTFDPAKDIATLHLNHSKTMASIKPIPVRTLPINHGDDVYTLGHPEGDPRIFESRGKYLGTTSLRSEAEKAFFPQRLSEKKADFTSRLDNQMIKLDALIKHGNSGGPVVDFTGGLLGMSTSRIDQTNSTLAVPASALSEHIKFSPKLNPQYTQLRSSYASKFASDIYNDPLNAAANTAILMAAARDMTPMALSSPRLIGFGAAGVGGSLMAADFLSFEDSFNNREMTQSALAMGFDGLLIAGGIGLVARKKTMGLSTLAAGVVGRVLTDFIPTGNYLRSLEQEPEVSNLRTASELSILTGAAALLTQRRSPRLAGMTGVAVGTVGRIVDDVKKPKGIDYSFWEWSDK